MVLGLLLVGLPTCFKLLHAHRKGIETQDLVVLIELLENQQREEAAKQKKPRSRGDRWRLVGRLKKREAAAKEHPRVMAAGVVWTSDHEKYAGELQPETRIVSDILIGEDYEGAQAWTLRDRPAREEEDFGNVFKSGELADKVERVEGSLVVYREFMDESHIA